LQPNATYTLTVAVGHRLDGYTNSYTIALQAGGTTLSSVSGNNSSIAIGTFQDQVVTYTTGSTVTPGDLAIVLTSGGIQVDFDYVRLSVNAAYYSFGDQVGTTHTVTDASGKLCYDADFTPYGKEMSHTERLQTTACPPNYRFTGYEYDPETANYYAFARYYSPRLGRFLSTDPLGGAIGNLQSHNAYAYVLNNPLSYVDPTGLTCYITVTDENGFTSNQKVDGANEGDCRKDGGIWLDPVDTTVVVTPGGDDGGTAAGGCASFYQDGVYIGNVCSGPTASATSAVASEISPSLARKCFLFNESLVNGRK
jgi:RHS repeat-associated protein